MPSLHDDSEFRQIGEPLEPRDELENQIDELSALVNTLGAFNGDRVDVSSLLDEATQAMSEAEAELAALDAADEAEDEAEDAADAPVPA